MDQTEELATPTAQDETSLGKTGYADKRKELLEIERKLRWDEPAKLRASQTELIAESIIFKIREHERKDDSLYGDVPGEKVPEEHTRDMGGRFLVNKPRVKESTLFRIARKMPKGAHLHLHFNAEIPPEALLLQARAPSVAETMSIRSTRPLISKQDFDDAEIVFQVLPAHTPKADIYLPSYDPDLKKPSNAVWMNWMEFCNRFPAGIMPDHEPDDALIYAAERWARGKMVITIARAYGPQQTSNCAWAHFNRGTRAFKGLVGYKSAYQAYVGMMIDSMVADGIMYAEVRPMLLDKFIVTDDGESKLDHQAQMEIICHEVEQKQEALRQKGELYKFPFGLKVIYCTPRSIPLDMMKRELNDCLELKRRFKDLICGFDLVGAEDRPNNIGFYAPLLVDFSKECAEAGLEIPYFFHAGETLLDTGGSEDPDNSNLYDSLLLNAKRIGHGYALLKHPYLIEQYKERNICLELCPISNELLGLCENVKQHRFPELLAAGLHCSLNADNPSLFSSSLSYEFCQAMLGDTRMTLHGWKQLAEWSLEHSCLSEEDCVEAMRIFAQKWAEFCEWVVDTYGDYTATLSD